MKRREFIIGAAAIAGTALVPTISVAIPEKFIRTSRWNISRPYSNGYAEGRVGGSYFRELLEIWGCEKHPINIRDTDVCKFKAEKDYIQFEIFEPVKIGESDERPKQDFNTRR